MSTAQADWDAKRGQGMTSTELWEVERVKQLEQEALDRPRATEPGSGSTRDFEKNPIKPFGALQDTMTAEQQIRAKALEIAAQKFDTFEVPWLLDRAREFYDYIRGNE